LGDKFGKSYRFGPWSLEICKFSPWEFLKNKKLQKLVFEMLNFATMVLDSTLGE
jgi:hypothetical protein